MYMCGMLTDFGIHKKKRTQLNGFAFLCLIPFRLRRTEPTRKWESKAYDTN